jgi:hypothetical protein
MVLSTTKRTASISSIVNQNQGGGPKKAGFGPIIGVTNWSHHAYGERGNYVTLKNLQTNRFKMFPNQNLPLGYRSQIKMY